MRVYVVIEPEETGYEIVATGESIEQCQKLVPADYHTRYARVVELCPGETGGGREVAEVYPHEQKPIERPTTDHRHAFTRPPLTKTEWRWRNTASGGGGD